MAINFPDPSQQTTYVADSGVTYEFIDGVWKATTFAGLGDVRYVNSTGDDMSGNLTIATDKISLNTDGSAYFASNVGIGTSSPARPLSVSSTQIGARFTSSSTDSQVEFVDTSGTVVYGSASGEAIVQTGGSESLRIATDGSATFAGNVISGSNPWNGASVGSRLYPQGGVFVTSLASNPVWRGWTQGSSTVTSEILGNGSATFAGTVDANALTVNGAAVDTSAQVDAKITALETSLTDGAPGALDTLNELAASLGDDSNFAGTVTNSLAGKANLSGATFTGEIKVEGSNTPSGEFSAISRFGSLLIGTTSELVSDAKVSIDSSSGNITSVGSATFASPSASTGGVEISRYGAYIRSDDSYPKALAIYNGGYTASDETILLNSNGNATFNGQVTTELAFVSRGNDSVNYLFQGQNGSGGEVCNIKNDGSATFTGDVTASAFIGDGSQLTGVGSETIISSTPPTPADYEVGTMWWNSDSTDTSLYILYQDPTGPNGDAGGKYWIEAAPAPDSIGFDGTHTGDSTFTGNMTVTGTVDAGPVNVDRVNVVNTTETGSDIVHTINTGSSLITTQRSKADGSLQIGSINGNSDTANIELNADGTATFAGSISAGNQIAIYRPTTTTSQYLLTAKSNVGGTEQLKFTLKADGSAEFGGSVITNGFNSSNGIATSPGIYVSNGSGVADGVNGAFISQNAAGNATTTIFSNGSATFAGGVAGDYFFAGRNTTDANLLSAAFGYTNTTTTLVKGTGIFLGTSLGNANGAVPDGTNLRLLTDGSAYFGGNLLVNTTSAIALGKASLEFYGQTQNGLALKSTWNGNNATYVAFINHANTSIGQIFCTTTSTTYGTSSDYRLKENVVDITDGIARVKQLSPKRFNFIADADTTVDGFIAHEAQTVVPEAVIGTKDEVDDDGNAVMQGIDKSKLVPLLTAALQEAIAKIETLEAKVAALEAS